MADTRKTLVTGLDLGQSADFTALAVLERFNAPGRPAVYAVRHLERTPLGTDYTAVGDRIARLFAGPPLAGTVLAVDRTGVGRPVVDMLRTRGVNADIRAVTITSGLSTTRSDDGGWRVPKRELVASLRTMLSDRRLQVAPGLSTAAALAEELRAFQVRVTAGANETFGAAAGLHDDLVLAVALAAWAGEQSTRPRPGYHTT